MSSTSLSSAILTMATVLNVPHARDRSRVSLSLALVILTLLAIANIPVHLPSDFQWPCSAVNPIEVVPQVTGPLHRDAFST